MKKWIYLFWYCFIAFSCQESTNNSIQFIDNEYSFFKNEELQNEINQYYEENLSKIQKGIITVSFNCVNDTSEFFISSIVNRDDLDLSVVSPSFYIEMNDFIVLFYTGIENYINFDSSYLTSLNKYADLLLYKYEEDREGNIIEFPPNYNPVIWKIKMASGKVVSKEVL